MKIVRMLIYEGDEDVLVHNLLMRSVCNDTQGNRPGPVDHTIREVFVETQESESAIQRLSDLRDDDLAHLKPYQVANLRKLISKITIPLLTTILTKEWL